jgi:putative restriction endonuclease
MTWQARHVADRAIDGADVRNAAMDWLTQRTRGTLVGYSFTATFEFEGRRLPLMDPQRGIRKPAGFDAALAIRTTFTSPNKVPPYNDTIGPDGLQRYKYRGTDPNHPENVALRRAFEKDLPLIWFVGTAPGLYEPIYPVWIVGDDPTSLEFVLALDPGQRLLTPGEKVDESTRKYVERLTKQRLHQRVFRSQVLLAYDVRCAVCNLGHGALLDAAHIIPDGQLHGEPVVTNGLTLCKIHHAAFDSAILGVRPDLTLHIRKEILEEHDGPMLRHGLQDMHDRRLMKIPRKKAARPDPARLEKDTPSSSLSADQPNRQPCSSRVRALLVDLSQQTLHDALDASERGLVGATDAANFQAA